MKAMPTLRRTRHMGMADDIKRARMSHIGGSDARIIMSGDQDEIERLWRVKRGEESDKDLSDVLVVQMGIVTENLNLDWFEYQTGLLITDEQSRPSFKEWPIATATLDGIVREAAGGPALGIYEAKFALPFYWNMGESVDKYVWQLVHNTMVTALDTSYLSVLTGGGQHAHIEIEADPFAQYRLFEAEQDFWDCVQTGRVPGNPRPPRPDVIVRTKVVDMQVSNSWADNAVTYVETKPFVDRFEKAKKGLKEAMPDDAKEASGHGVKLYRSKDGRVLIKLEDAT